MTLALLLLLRTAQAEELLVPRWDQPVRYHAEALISTPNGMLYYAKQNLDASVTSTEILVEMACSGRPDGKGWAVDCVLDTVRIGGSPYPGDQADFDAIAAEYAGNLTGATVELQVAADGRITNVGLVGAERVDERMATILESQRQILRRAFAPLDLALPKNGIVKEKWKHKGTPLLFELFTSYGTTGGSAFSHELKGPVGPSTAIESSGRANVSTGLDLEVGAGQIVNMIGGGAGRFDANSGQTLWRELSVTGELTAESVQLGDTHVYGLVAWVGRIEADGAIQGAQGPVAPTP